MKNLLFLLMLLTPIATSAQQMSKSKAKQAGVVVLYDKYVNPSGTKGNMIILRLRDKSRPKHNSNEIMVHEVCLETKVNQVHNVTIDKGELDMDESGLGTLNLEGLNIMLNLEDGGMVFHIYNQHERRKYKIEHVRFYKVYTDMFVEGGLGEEWNLNSAYQYIMEMFKPYQ